MKLKSAMFYAGLALTACGAPKDDGSQTLDLARPSRVGDASGKHGKPEVFIYYANETAPDATEQKNWDSVIKTLKSDAATAYIADRLETDLRLFPMIVDAEVDALKDYFCSAKNKTNTSLVIFTNRLVRAGIFEYCKAGEPATIGKDQHYSKFSKKMQSDFRLLSNPNSHVDTLRWALARTRLIFNPKDHLYDLVVKSHGNADNLITPRLHVDASKITPEQLLSELKSSIQPAAAGPMTRDVGALTLEEVRAEIERLKNDVAASDAALERLLKNELGTNAGLTRAIWGNELIKNELMKNELVKNELVKNELIKNELVKNELMKNELVKNELLKNELIKNELLKNELVKNELMKNELIKNELVKNELVKNELVKNELVKNELIKNELVKNELVKNELTKNELEADAQTVADGVDAGTPLARATLPRIGISKRQFLGELAAAQNRNNDDKSMYFSLVFTEACRSFLPWDVKAEMAEASTPLRIDWFATSDEGSVAYKNVDYPSFLGSLDGSKPVGEALAAKLDAIVTGGATAK